MHGSRISFPQTLLRESGNSGNSSTTHGSNRSDKALCFYVSIWGAEAELTTAFQQGKAYLWTCSDPFGLLFLLYNYCLPPWVTSSLIGSIITMAFSHTQWKTARNNHPLFLLGLVQLWESSNRAIVMFSARSIYTLSNGTLSLVTCLYSMYCWMPSV